MSDSEYQSWIGKTLNQAYRVESLLGEGAQSLVYGGYDLSSKLPVAIKRFKKVSKGVPNDPERFLREARNQSCLDHPNVVTIHAVFEEDDEYYIVVEFIEGSNLEVLLAASDSLPRLSLEQISHLFSQVLNGLEHAHDKGIIHRDIKPANLLITPSFHLKIVDFGLARSAQDTKLTQIGHMIGTPAYMSPEQAEGKESIDLRCDIYSVGITLYEILCGSTPFQHSGEKMMPFELIARHLFMDPPPLKDMGVKVSERLESVVLRSIAKAPDARFSSCSEFRIALTEAIDDVNDNYPKSFAETDFEMEAIKETNETFAPLASHALPNSELPTIPSAVPSSDLKVEYELEQPFGVEISEFERCQTIRLESPSERVLERLYRKNRVDKPKVAFVVFCLAFICLFGFWYLSSGSRTKKEQIRVRNASNNKRVPMIRSLTEAKGAYPRKLSWVRMVFVPKGTYFSGYGKNLKEKKGHFLPFRKIYLEPYWIDQFEVTMKDYLACVRAGGCIDKRGKSFHSQRTMMLPVVFIEWSKAREFCLWMEKDLPTEAQWEKAARGFTRSSYPWGEKTPNCSLAHSASCGKKRSKVGIQFRTLGQSPFAAYDMAGNVSEWTRDCYSRKAWRRSVEPLVRKKGCERRVLRGGSWRSRKSDLKIFLRSSKQQSARKADVGFRCVWSKRF